MIYVGTVPLCVTFQVTDHCCVTIIMFEVAVELDSECIDAGFMSERCELVSDVT